MAGDRGSLDVRHSVYRQDPEQTRQAMANYGLLFGNGVWASPINRALRACVERNIELWFEFSHRLLRARDYRDVVHIQKAFVQAQLETLTPWTRQFPEATRVVEDTKHDAEQAVHAGRTIDVIEPPANLDEANDDHGVAAAIYDEEEQVVAVVSPRERQTTSKKHRSKRKGKQKPPTRSALQ